MSDHGAWLKALAAGVAIALSTTSVLAEVASEDEARVVCQNWLNYLAGSNVACAVEAPPKIVSVDLLMGDDGALAYVYALEPDGFVLVPVLKELPPIQAYSLSSTIDVAETEGMTQLFREILEHRLNLFSSYYGALEASTFGSGDGPFPPENRAAWDLWGVESKDGAVVSAIGGSVVGPLVDSTWEQGSPYNAYCPYGYNGTTVVGCVATATSQIMRFFQWPDAGVGSHSYYWYGDDSCNNTRTSGATLSADFSDSYEWSLMPTTLTTTMPSTHRAAVAELCYEVGVAFNMDYGVCGSGAYTASAVTVLPTYFRYHDSIDYEARDSHTAQSWFAAIQAEINARRPMIYRIYAHALVCDGWRDDSGLQMYHLNYGWGGYKDTWYAVDNAYCDWSGCDPMVEFIVRRIMPDPDCDDDGIADYAEIYQYGSDDLNGNGIPDECEAPDCDGDGTPDDQEPDCDGDGTPDDCEVTLPGDVNCDGAVNAFDIDPFVSALVSPATYAAEYNCCDILAADCDGDGSINAFDIDPFVAVLVGQN